MSISYEEWDRQWFALCTDGWLVALGDHGDYEAAEFTSRDLGLDVILIMRMNDWDAEQAEQSQTIIETIKGLNK